MRYIRSPALASKSRAVCLVMMDYFAARALIFDNANRDFAQHVEYEVGTFIAIGVLGSAWFLAKTSQPHNVAFLDLVQV